MNEEAVKKLTKQGCMVGKEAAEKLTMDDVERIDQLEATPMYVSGQMLENVRQKTSQKVMVSSSGSSRVETETDTENSIEKSSEASRTPIVEEDKPSDEEDGPQPMKELEDNISEDEEDRSSVKEKDDSENADDEEVEEHNSQDAEEAEAQEIVKDEGDSEASEDVDESIYGRRSSHFQGGKTVQIRDDRRRDELDTKVEIMDDYEVSQSEKDVPEFLGYYNDRYDKMKRLLMRRSELRSATAIQRLERRSEGDEAATVGLVKDKYSTNSGKYIVTLEDKTGTFKALVDEREGDKIVQDEMIGVHGSMGGDIIYANSVVRADLPIPDGVKTTKDEVKAAYISDLHIGSEDTLHDRLDRFAKWLGTSEASKIGYLVMPGDVVEGVGVYPGQEDELEVPDIYKQYNRFEDWVEKIPEDIQVIVGPGNHDITRLAEPQPKIDKSVFDRVTDFNNFHLVNNPQTVRLHGIRSKGIKNLMYHGYSFDDQIDAIKELRENAYEEPYRVMVDLLKRRHLAPTYGSNLLSPEQEDHLVIDQKPDVFVAGHLHSHSNYSYKGVNVIAASTFQAQTDFQKRVGHEPDPGKVTIINYKNRNTEVKQF
ncbi:metallophosphoesterase [Candidatus Nanosalina sp. VS9-1]|uniref:metallophosphoesterase n=1 Tax=Candidatus Nanosalina sp. VS9-1 TaxID=3388566 RepID=UPI0039E14E57